MTYQEELYAHLVNGGDPQVLLDAFMRDLNEAQRKADAQLEKEKQEEENKAKKEAVRAIAVENVVNYLTLVFPNKSREELEIFAKADVDATVQSIQMMESIKISKDGNSIKVDMSDLFDWLL